jgi:hypothetical protein
MNKNSTEQINELKNELSISDDELNYDNLKKSKQYVIKNNYWNNYHEEILKGLQINTNKLCKEYQKAHLIYKSKLKLYRIPIIVMSSLSGFLSISISGYIPRKYQAWISLLVGFVNLMVTLISLIENFKKIDVNVNKTYTSYIEFKKLHDEISIMLSISQNERESNGYDTVMQYFARYEAYITDAPILRKTIHDVLDENSPDNSSETLIISGSDNFSNNSKNVNLNLSSKKNLAFKLSDDDTINEVNEDNEENEYEEINLEEGRVPTTYESLKKMLKISKQINNSGIIKKNNYVEVANKKLTNQITQDRIAKVNRFQEQFEKMEKNVDNAIGEKITKINNEKKLNISFDNFPKIKNIKASENFISKKNLNNILKDSVDDFNFDEDELIDEGLNDKKENKDVDSSSSSSSTVL